MTFFSKSFAIALAATAISLAAHFFPLLDWAGWLVIVALALWYAWKNPPVVLLIATLEWVAGHQGHLFEFFGISIRTALLLIIFAAAFRYLIVCNGLKNCLVNLRSRFLEHAGRFLPFIIVYVLVIVAALVGLTRGIEPGSVFSAALNYAFYLLAIPVAIFWDEVVARRDQWIPWLAGALAATALVTFALFVLFSWDVIAVHGDIYTWWRDFAIGKATDTGAAFFRITSSSHLLFLLFLFALLYIWRNGGGGLRRRLLLFIAMIAATLVINFSRAYFLGIALGALLLLVSIKKAVPAGVGDVALPASTVTHWRMRQGIVTVLMVSALFIASFFALNLVASRGTSFGLELLSARARSLTQPGTETSSRLRTEILPVLIKTIKQSPVWGRGLGTKITFWSPSAGQFFSTRSYDWGYLQLWIELGALGLIVVVALAAWIFFSHLTRYLRSGHTGNGVAASTMAAVLVTAVFGPTLFHPLGIVMIVFLWRLLYHAGD